MLAVPFTAIQLQDEEEDSEANPIIAAIRGSEFVVKHGATIAKWAKTIWRVAVVGDIAWNVYDLVTPDDPETKNEDLRREEARLLSRSLADGTSVYADALNNYQNIWGLTQEHWTRQAELTASAYWKQNGTYSPYDTLTDSGTYYNSALMLVNATNQINEQFSTVAKHIGEWNSSDYAGCYGDGKMKLRFSIGSSFIEADSGDSFTARMGQVVGSGNDRTVHNGQTAVYYVGGPVYVSADATMTRSDGVHYDLKAGWNESLPAVDGWTGADVYRLTPGVTYFGNFMYVLESDSANVQGGIIVSDGTDAMIVSSDGTYLYDGQTVYTATKGTHGYDLFKLFVIPQNTADTQSSDVTAMLVYYGLLNGQINKVIQKVNQNAHTVWDIYDSAGSASMYLTTLNVPDTYENVNLTDEQKRLLVTLYMDQLSSWWKDTEKKDPVTGEKIGEIKKDNYRMTQDSLSLYCRGDIITQGVGDDGSVKSTLKEGVAFTPIFYKSTSLRTGTQELESQCFVLVYGECSSLSGFDTAAYENCDLVYLGKGSSLAISEMYYDGKPVSSVDLEASQVDYIDPEKMGDWDPTVPHPSNDMAELIRLIFLVIGGACMAYGLGRGNPIFAVIGLILIAFGLIASEPLAGLLEKQPIGWTFHWPW